MNRAIILLSTLALAACEGGFNPKDGVVKVVDGDVIDTGTGAETPSIEPAPTVGMAPVAPSCDMGREYVGFGGGNLAADRDPGEVGEEQRRPKPFSALSTEFPRVLGNTPPRLTGSESTFGVAPARWYTEPTMSAVTIYTVFRVAFEGCLTVTAQPAKFNTAPTDTTARAECAAWAERFWSRKALEPELDACVQVTVRDSAVETSARRRWAYGCAATLSSSDFLTF
ncbi:MAG: hypothetical protein IAE78_19060 [Myxococcus sp.]|nr:hypothetical protein [Myxococcus sp.]